MENTVVALLLLCALSSAEEALSQANSHLNISDLYKQLGDMRAQQANDTLLIEQLQKDKEELEAKLKEEHSQLDSIEKKLKALTMDVRSQQETDTQMMEQLQTLNQRQVAQRNTLKKTQVGRVAFSASLRTSQRTVGPFRTHTPLVYTYVFTNIGNAYNPITGVFTAPVKGAYHFEFYVCAEGTPSHGTAAYLVKNGVNIVAALERQSGGIGTAANGATLPLEVGDRVFVRLWKNNIIYDNNDHCSTFSGHLLFAV